MSCTASGQCYTHREHKAFLLICIFQTSGLAQNKLTRGEVLKGSYLLFPTTVWNIRHGVCITKQIKITEAEGRLQVKVFLQKNSQPQAPCPLLPPPRGQKGNCVREHHTTKLPRKASLTHVPDRVQCYAFRAHRGCPFINPCNSRRGGLPELGAASPRFPCGKETFSQ